jgi:sugar transferase (PEP-CTERM system associated)
MRVGALRLTARPLVLIVCETMLIVVAVGAAAYLRLGSRAWDVVAFEYGVPKALFVAGIVQACLYYTDLYDLRRLSDRRELFIGMLNALAWASMILAAVYYWFPTLIIALVIGWRIAFEWASRQMRPRERLLLVGTSTAAVSLAAEIFSRRHELGVEIVGFIDPDPIRRGSPVLNPGVIGAIDDIPSIVRARRVDRVVVSLADARGQLPMDKLLDLRVDGVHFDRLASVYEEYTGKIAVENLRPSWLIFSGGFRKTRALTTCKRLLDITVSLVGLFLAWPLMIVIVCAVRLSSRGQALYHQQRVGQDGRIFTVHKFRSMRLDAEADTGPTWAAKHGDTRVTTVGGWLRRTRLDELPQLWNVLKGDMSFVGPRPERPEFVGALAREIPYYGLRHVVRPGLTGWAQVRYTYGASKEDALEKLQYDLYYIKNLSIAFDLFVILSTVKTVLLGKGA